MEASKPWPHDSSEKEATRPRGLVRKPSKLQVSVEVMKCRIGSIRRRPTKKEDEEFRPQKHWMPIYHAVYQNRETALLHFFQNGGSPDDVEGTGMPPICIAAASGHVKIVEMLLEAGADLNATTKTLGETALHIAIRKGHAEIFHLLLARGPDTELRTTKTGETSLHYAASKFGSLSIVVALLKAGAKHDVQDAGNRSAAEAALLSNNLRAAIAIINSAHERGDSLVKEKDMLSKHIEKARFSNVNDLIADVFATLCSPDSTVLMEAINRNDTNLVEMLLRRGDNPDRQTTNGSRPIFTALQNGAVEVIRALIKHNVDVKDRNAGGQSVLQVALESPLIKNKKALFEVFDSLLHKGADATATYPDGSTLLHHAVAPAICHPEIAGKLLERGAKSGVQDIDGNTALHIATHDTSCIRMLLKHGADPYCVNGERLTPLLYATTKITKSAEPDLEPLIKLSNVRNTNAQNRTALHMAASKGLEKTTHGLLRAGSQTAAVDSAKSTPLLLAVVNRQWSIVPHLAILPGANAWGDDGMTALHQIAKCTPRTSEKWSDIVFAVRPFCMSGTSRSMRNRSGATPLIQAVKTLPEEGLPVVEAMLSQNGEKATSRNCIDHEDHKGHVALHYAVTLCKPRFVETLLRHGATFNFEDWTPDKKQFDLSNKSEKMISKHLAQAEWMRRVSLLRRQSNPNPSAPSMFSEILSAQDLTSLLSMGLDPKNLPKSSLGSSLLWIILRQVLLQPPPLQLEQYLHDTMSIALEAGADPNSMTSAVFKRSSTVTKGDLPLPRHPLTFLLEEVPTVDAKLVALLLGNGAKCDIASPYYGGRYPIHAAVKAQSVEMVTTLLAHGADINCQASDGRTPLFIAVQNTSHEIVEALLSSGAKTSIKDKELNTPLHAAASGGNKDIVARLLRARASACRKNAKGLTPRESIPDTVAEGDRESIVMILKGAEEKETKIRQRASESGRTTVQITRSSLPASCGPKVVEDRQSSSMKTKSRPYATLMPQTTSVLVVKEQLSASRPSAQPTSPLLMNPPSNFFASTSDHVTAPASPTLLQEKLLSTSPKSAPSSPLLTVPDSSPHRCHRADSGLGHVDSTTTVEMNTNKSKSMTCTRQSGGELAGWLAVSKLLGDL
jgi:ankyrin repeat protein